MDHNITLQAAADFIARHPTSAGLVLGLFTFFESLVFIGAFVPATPLMVLAGGLIATGALDPISVILFASAGAALGDAISYTLGRRWGVRALNRTPLGKQRRALARARLLTRRLGPASIYVGRFFGPLRAFVPTAAGMFGMAPRKFQIANVSSALVWVLVMLAPGYFGMKAFFAWESLDDVLTVAAIAAVVLVVLAIAGWRFLGAATKRTRPRKPADSRVA